MKLIVSAKNMELTGALKSIVDKKLARLDKYFDKDVEARVTLGVQKLRQIIEVTIPFNGVVLRGEEASDDMYTSIDLVIDKLERQIRKQKTKLSRRNNTNALKFQAFDEYKGEQGEDTKEARIVKTKRFAFKPMSPEEAVLQMELVGHDFFIYNNADSEKLNVVYKRKDGNYGLIEPEY